jgi:hypothetical protein
MSNGVLPFGNELQSGRISLDEGSEMNRDVLQELECILASPAFRNSSRSQAFLRHVVHFAHAPEELKERVLGAVLFGRAPDYDTGADAIVRVKASEVRRRLTEYAANANPERTVRIELQTGSYVPRIIRKEEFLQPATVALPIGIDSATDPAHANKSNNAWWKTSTMRNTAIVLMSIALLLGMAIRWSSSSTKRFMKPLLLGEKPIICISHPNAYNLDRVVRKRKGDAGEALHLSEYLQQMGRSSRISVSQDITAQDFQSSPVILIGGPRFNNWTNILTQDLRFSFEMVDGKPRIVDRLRPTRFWADSKTADVADDQGYVVVTRLLATKDHNAVLAIAGLHAIDTRAGVKVVVDSHALKQLLMNAPEDWEKRNLQWVIQLSQLRNDTKPKVDLRAATYW